MLFGRFLELAIATHDIVASVQFYERLGFTQLITGDAWSRRYGVLSDGRLYLGLHEYDNPSPALSFVHPELRRALPELEAAGFAAERTQFGEDELHRLWLRDPGRHAVRLLEARTYSPAAGDLPTSRCGYFVHYSLPQHDRDAAGAWWQRAGFVALSELYAPYTHLSLTSDALTLALHSPRVFAAPLLVFEAEDLGGCLQYVHAQGVRISAELPHGLQNEQAALLHAPEGTALLVVQASE